MDWIKTGEKFGAFFNRYKYVILVLAIGIILMVIPGRTDEAADAPANANTATQVTDEKQSLSDELSAVLSQVEGAGKVQVVLTISAGEETYYQSDDEITTGQDTGTTRRSTVIITDSQRGQNGLIRQINPPVYQGAIIICQGADSPVVRLAMIEAVSNATGLGTDRISVLKMK